ncbi:hypothetical protein ACFQ23_13420, partial [Schaalia naturae]|uniref:hypothetical protein n=1 Tax=Schaalia naturae TaxID=635203 RepID=UPI0036338EFC
MTDRFAPGSSEDPSEDWTGEPDTPGAPRLPAAPDLSDAARAYPQFAPGADEAWMLVRVHVIPHG